MLGGSAPVDTWTVLFTDLVGSTQMRSRLGEEAFDRVRSDHDELMRSVVSRHGGAVVKFMGDGVMAVFGGASPALSCACDLQRSVEDANLGAAEPIHIRVGLSMGDAIVDGDDLHGIAVVEARRLCDAAVADEILCSAVVRQAAGSRGGHRFGPVANRDLKGLSEPLLTCPLEWRLDSAPSAPAGLQVGVFGGIAIARGGQPIDLGGPKERAVLAALIAADGQPVSVDSLIDAVWRDDPPRSATRTIHAYIARLRSALGGGSSDSVLFTRGRSYVLELPTDAVDERRFVAGARRGRQLLDQSDGGAACLVLDEALREWSGRPYDGYEEIDRCAAAIRRLEEVRRAAVEDRFDALLDLGHAGDIVAEITAAVDDDPLSERRWGQLMLALYRGGRQADALRAYRRARTVLAEELGVEPGPQLRELESAILRHDTDRLHGAGDEPTVVLPAALDPAGRAMFGRSDELERLRSVWSEVTLGRGALMSVVGPEGIGKSRLVAELAASAHENGAVVMYARCDADHRTARALFDQALRSAGGSLMRTQSEGLPGERLGVRIARRLTTWAADRPVLVVVDDLNLADGDVLEVVADAAGAATRAAVLFLPLFRTDRGDIVPPPVGAQLALSGLDREATAAIAALYRDDWSATDIDHLHDATGGVPLAVHEQASAIARGAAAGRVEQAADSAGRASVALVSSQEAVADEVLGIRRLLARRRRELGGRVETTDALQTATSDECPFRGLRAFDVADAEWFFGRERSVAQVVAQLAANSTVAVVGASGSGKSSLVRAGVLPTLAAGVLPGSESWRPVVLTPGVDPVAALTVAHEVGASSADRLVVVIDQLEELFTAPSDDAREQFASELAELAASGAALIVAIRADQFARLADVPTLSGLLVGNEVLIGPPTERELRDAVAGPAAHGGLELDDGLVDEIIADSRGSVAVLPLVQTALLETWVRRDGATLTIEGYRESGGVTGAVARLAESAYGSLSPAEQRAAWRILLRLADASEDGAFDLRRRVPMAELMRHDDHDGRLAVDRLVESRLLTLSGDAVEVTHEALFREWPRLRRWLDEDLQGRQLHQRLGEAARSWVASGRDPSELLRGTRLAAADEWATRHGDELNDIESELLDASRAEMRRELLESEARADREAKTNRRLRRLLAGTALLAVLALVTGAVALAQRNRAQDAADAAEAATATAETAADQAEDARASEAVARNEAEQQADRFAMTSLLAESEAARANERDLAALLAVAAHRIEPGPESLSALFGLFTDAPGIERTIRLDGARLVRMVMFPDEQHVAVLDAAHVVRLIDLDSGSVVQTFEPAMTSNGAGRLAVSPDGGRLAASSYDAGSGTSTLSLWDVARGARIAQPVDVGFYPGSVEFSRDGSLIAVAGGADGDVLVVDGSTGDPLLVIPGSVTTSDRSLIARNAAATFLPDGTLAISSADGPLRVVDPLSGDVVRAFDLPPQAASTELAVSPDGSVIFGSGRLGMGAWSLVDGRPMWPELAVGMCQELQLIDFNSSLLCSRLSGDVVAHDQANGATLPVGLALHEGAVTSMAATSDGRRLTVTGVGAVVVTRLDGAGPITRIVDERLDRVPQQYLDDGRLLVAQSVNDLAIPNLDPDIVDVATLAVTDPLDGIFAAVPAPGRPGQIGVATAPTVATFYDTVTRTTDPEISIALPFTPGNATTVGDLIVVFNPAQAQAIDAKGQLVEPAFDMPVPAENWMLGRPDGQGLFTFELEGMVARDLMGDRADVPAVPDVIDAVVAGSHIIARTSDGRLLRLAQDTLDEVGDPLPSLSGTSGLMSASADGAVLISGDRAGAARLIDLESAAFIGGLISLGHFTANPGPGPDAYVAMRPDGRQFAITSSAGVLVWDLDPEIMADAACARAGRDLTDAEWDRYIGSLARQTPLCDVAS